MIKMIIMDVDGTLTDGKIYIGPQGEVMKAFSVKDGLGITKLNAMGIKPVILTARSSEIVTNRAMELKIEDVYQGIHDKITGLDMISKKYNIGFNEIAYIGDDENDLECMKACGYSGCPADATSTIKNVVNFISVFNGGNGAVREFIEHILVKA
ncbi:KdsC family phosphatase [Paenibacillus sp. FSL R7-0179]|uniref:KdsC family phosphatase n=1 Tax=Paenibacillus sp. FSL R7-0179 TaxID=2921672 RepID=UPI0030F60A3A